MMRESAMRTDPQAFNDALIVWAESAEDITLSQPSLTDPEASTSVWLEQWRAERVRVVILVVEDEIRTAWAVKSMRNELATPMGHARRLNRATFNLRRDERLKHLENQALGADVDRRRGRATVSLDSLLIYQGPRWTAETSDWPTMRNDETLTASGADIQKRHGRHYTPEILADFLAERLIRSLGDLDRVRVLDPACGDGELLFAVSRVAARHGKTFSLELVGFDLDADAISVAASRAAGMGLSASFECADFLVASEGIPAGRFDAIITNPPYVRTQHLGATTARLLADKFGLEGRIDLTHPFVAIAPRLLSPDGVIALLCSNRFLSTKAGANVRTVLMRSMTPTEIYDLGDTKLFGAAVLPAIIIAGVHEHSGEPTKFVSAYEVPGVVGMNAQPLFDALSGSATGTAQHGGKHYEVKVGTFTAPSDVTTPWRLSSPASDEWLESVKAGTWKTFGEVAKIRVGIKTTADKVFLGETWDRTAPEVEGDLLLPLITQSNVTPWSIDSKLEMKVLYPYDLRSQKRQALNIDEWPGAKQYLLNHEEQLRGRKYVIEGGREWWEIWVPQRPSLWATPKIVFPDISEQPRFALDSTGAVVNGNCYWISLDDIGDEDIAFLMLAVANSAIGVRYYDEVCGNKLYSGKRRWITQYVNRLPLPAPTTPEAKQLIARARALVESDALDAATSKRLDAEVEAAFAASARAGRTPLHESFEMTLF